MFVCSKSKIGCSSSITNRWTRSSSFDVQKMMFKFDWCSMKWYWTHHYRLSFTEEIKDKTSTCSIRSFKSLTFLKLFCFWFKKMFEWLNLSPFIKKLCSSYKKLQSSSWSFKIFGNMETNRSKKVTYKSVRKSPPEETTFFVSEGWTILTDRWRGCFSREWPVTTSKNISY